MRGVYLAGVTIALALSTGASAADERPEIQTGRGHVSASLAGTLRHGDRDIYPINATGGQTLTVSLVSPSNDATLVIFPPGTHYSQDQTQIWTFHGSPVRGADGDAADWSGQITSGGRYLIVVGGGLGRTDYTLHVSIQ